MAARSSRATILEPATPASGLSPRNRRSKRLRVLLVEPDVRYRSELGTALAEAGFEVAMVASGEDAREELAAGTALPSLIVTETELPGMDGFTFCGQVRADLRTAQVPLFLLASRREPFHLELAANMGADDYLSKPVLVQDVVALARLKAGRRTGELEYEAHSARLPLTEIARALLAGARSGRVVLKDGGDGFFAFRGGRVVDAAFQGERSVLGFRRLLAFGSGVFGVTFGPELHRGSLLMDLPFLRTEVLPSLERFERLREVGVPLAARLTVDFPQLAEHLSELPDDVIALVRLFDGRRTVRAVLLECRLPEVVAFEAVMQLFVLGVLMPASRAEERERALDAPRFFEPLEVEAARVAREADARDAEERAAEALEERVLLAKEPQAEAAPAPAPAPTVEEAPAVEAPRAPVPAQEAVAAESREPEISIDVDGAASAEPSIPLVPIPVILSFPKSAARRRDEGKARARPVEVFSFASGETRPVR
jgi:CheY-like chemotaxis protein